MNWRRLSGVFIFGLLAATLRAAAPAPLDAAMRKLMADENRWAYTQTTQKFDRADKASGGVQVERFDPSQPPDEQWTLQLRDGQPPTARELRAWRKRKAKEMKRREERSLGEVIDFDRAQPVRETPAEIVYEIPLKPEASRRWPAEKFVVFMTVDRAGETLGHLALKTRESFRMAVGVAKVEQIEINAEFQTIDAQYVPQPARILVSGAARVLFIRVGGRAEIGWTEFKRVTPYDDRFVVEPGELKVLDF